jgi:1-acyl-sn-glycerol-3-phosphate acyltransferase
LAPSLPVERHRPRRHPPRQSLWLRPVNHVGVGGLAYLALRMRRAGQEHIPADGPVLIVCNHVAFIDALLVATAALPRRSWQMAKEELFRSRPLAAWMRRSGGFPVRRATPDVWAVRTALDLLTRGECLLLSPRGVSTGVGACVRGSPGPVTWNRPAWRRSFGRTSGPAPRVGAW